MFNFNFLVFLYLSLSTPLRKSGCYCDVMVKALDCGVEVNVLELQSRYYVHFQTNTLGKDMNLLILYVK